MKNSFKKVGAVSLILGAFLNMIRMFPITLEVGIDGYPPKNLSETIEIAQGTGYFISHAMVFFATPLFILGFYGIYKELRKSTQSRWLTLSLVIFFIGQLFYLIGVVLHGLILPEMAHEYLNLSAIDQNIMKPLFDFNHHLATGYGGLGFAFCLVSTGILGLFLRHKFKLLGNIAMVLGIVALIGYSTGLLAILLFKSFMLTAGFITIMFVFYFATGVKMYASSEFND